MKKAKRLKDNSEEKTSISGKLSLIISIIFILGGSVIFLYPNISNYFAQKNQIEAIRQYDELVVNTDEETLKKEWQKAQTYNENLSGEPVHDPFVAGSGYALPDNYKDVLNISQNGIMAYIDIPKISVYLPIYHGTNDEALTKGVGHIQSTSLPIGGNSTHCVLTGHTGLPSAELFTRLDELIVDDIFYINILGKILTYKVYETKVILPDKIDELQVESGKDYITLVTCTPYGVNTHRLLVKATQTEYEEYKKPNFNEQTTTENTKKNKNYYITGIQIGIIVFIIMLIIIFIVGKLIRRKNNKNVEDIK